MTPGLASAKLGQGFAARSGILFSSTGIHYMVELMPSLQSQPLIQPGQTTPPSPHRRTTPPHASTRSPALPPPLPPPPRSPPPSSPPTRPAPAPSTTPSTPTRTRSMPCTPAPETALPPPRPLPTARSAATRPRRPGSTPSPPRPAQPALPHSADSGNVREVVRCTMK